MAPPAMNEPSRPPRGPSRLQLQMASMQRVHCMPAIPEEDSTSQNSIDPSQRAKDLLRIALSQDIEGENEPTNSIEPSEDKPSPSSTQHDEESDYKIKSALTFLHTLTSGSLISSNRERPESDLEKGDSKKVIPKRDSNSKKISKFLHQMTSKVEDMPGYENEGLSASKSYIQKQYNSIVSNFHEDSIRKASESGVCGLRNAVLATDRLHPSSNASFLISTLSYFLFSLVNVIVVGILLFISFLLYGFSPSYVLIVGMVVWLCLFIFNVGMGFHPLRVLRVYLHNQKKFQLGTSSADGKIVLVRGVVSPCSRNTIRSEFLEVSGCVLIQTEFKCKEKKRRAMRQSYKQTRAVDFYVTDSSTGLSVLVEAGSFLTSGLTVPILQTSPHEVTERFEMPTPPVFPSSDRYQHISRSVELVQYSVRERYLRSGQVATVMGTLHHTQVHGEFVLKPLQERRNISNFMLWYNFIPFFYPTWVAGLLISDDSA